MERSERREKKAASKLTTKRDEISSGKEAVISERKANAATKLIYESMGLTANAAEVSSEPDQEDDEDEIS